jgi:hypothetical protein
VHRSPGTWSGILSVGLDVSTALDPPRQAQQVPLTIERVEIRPPPGRDRPSDRFVAVEQAFEHAFAASRRPQLELQLVHVRRRNLTFERPGRTPQHRRPGYCTQPRQHRPERAERVCGELEAEAVIGSHTTVPARFSAPITISGVRPRKSAPVLDISLANPWWA